MCYFVLVGFSPEARSIARGLLRSACHLRETTNPSVLGALPAGWHAGYLADEMCGCDMYADPATEDAPSARDERLATFRQKHSKPKYRKRGWSDAKIERAIHQMKEDAASRRPSSTPHASDCGQPRNTRSSVLARGLPQPVHASHPLHARKRPVSPATMSRSASCSTPW